MCSEKNLNSILYSNRAICNKELGNLRTAIKDSMWARKFNPENYKVRSLKIYLIKTFIGNPSWCRMPSRTKLWEAMPGLVMFIRNRKI